MEDKKKQITQESPKDVKYTVMPGEFRKGPAKKGIDPKILMIGGGVLVLFGLSAGAVLFFIRKPAPPAAINEEVSQPVAAPEEVPPETASTTASEEQPSLLAPAETPAAQEKPSAPEIPAVGELVPGADADADGLTDKEEVVFQTDPTRPDTDGDGFLDGNEVYNLYSPIAPPPVTLLESGLVKLFRNSASGYTIYYPVLWTASSSIAGDEAGFKAPPPDADSINITVMEAAEDVGLRGWYQSQYPEADIKNLQSYTSKQGYQGLQDAERLNTYIKKGKKVLIISYDLGLPENSPAGKTAWYRALYGMMLNSLRIE